MRLVVNLRFTPRAGMLWRTIKRGFRAMKGYWIAHVTVSDPEQYKLYADSAPSAFQKHKARILARGGRHAQLEGLGRPRNVVIEFPSFEAAIACYNSPEYQEAKNKRKDAGLADIVIVEGVE